MAGTAHPGRAHRCLVGILLEPANQLLKAVRWQIFLSQEQQRRVREQRDRFEIADHIVLQRVGYPVGDMRVPDADGDRVSVRRGARHPPVPMLPVAPPTFSMMMAWPSAVRMPSAIRRPTTSVSAAGGNGTIIVIGRDG